MKIKKSAKNIEVEIQKRRDEVLKEIVSGLLYF